jgi:hypothetical protein
VQVAHIYGVRPGAPRYQLGMPDSERDSFKNLLQLCLPHHAKVDDKRTGATLYPAEELLKWKRNHEGKNNAVLNQIGPVDEERFMELIAEIFVPPLQRLEAIAEQLERLERSTPRALRSFAESFRFRSSNPKDQTPARSHYLPTQLR